MHEILDSHSFFHCSQYPYRQCGSRSHKEAALLDEGDGPEVDVEVSATRCGMQVGEIDEAGVFATRCETPAEEVGGMEVFATRCETPAGELDEVEFLGTRSEEGEDGSPTE